MLVNIFLLMAFFITFNLNSTRRQPSLLCPVHLSSQKISSMKKTIVMALASSLFFACSNQKTEDKSATTDTTVAAAPAKVLPTEIGDAKYVDIGKSGNANLSSGNIDAWMAGF